MCFVVDKVKINSCKYHTRRLKLNILIFLAKLNYSLTVSSLLGASSDLSPL